MNNVSRRGAFKQQGYRWIILVVAIVGILTSRQLRSSGSLIKNIVTQPSETRGLDGERSPWTVRRERLALDVAFSDPRLPKPPVNRVTKPEDKILVVYSGPTEVVNRAEVFHPKSTESQRKKELYRVNFEYFLQYGVQCETQDTVIVVTEDVRLQYQARIDVMNSECQTLDHSVILVSRKPECMDVESVRRVLMDGVVKNLEQYDYFICTCPNVKLTLAVSIYCLTLSFQDVNCGVSGPSKHWARLPWTDAVLAPLNDRVKMAGLSLNCAKGPHVQSMMYAVDRIGLQAIINSTAIFDCADKGLKAGSQEEYTYLIQRYELGLSKAIMNAGYGITSIMGPELVVFKKNKTFCSEAHRGDRWIAKLQIEDYGRLLDLHETLFFKTSRFMSEATKREINFTLDANFKHAILPASPNAKETAVTRNGAIASPGTALKKGTKK